MATIVWHSDWLNAVTAPVTLTDTNVNCDGRLAMQVAAVPVNSALPVLVRVVLEGTLNTSVWFPLLEFTHNPSARMKTRQTLNGTIKWIDGPLCHSVRIRVVYITNCAVTASVGIGQR